MKHAFGLLMILLISFSFTGCSKDYSPYDASTLSYSVLGVAGKGFFDSYQKFYVYDGDYQKQEMICTAEFWGPWRKCDYKEIHVDLHSSKHGKYGEIYVNSQKIDDLKCNTDTFSSSSENYLVCIPKSKKE